MTRLRHKFVDSIPEFLDDATLYISFTCDTVVHRCACGCGNETVTPLAPTDWRLIYDGESVSLLPSIGNWAFPCRSHYFIADSKVQWAPQWSDAQIEAGRAWDRELKRRLDVEFKGESPLLNRDPAVEAKSPWYERFLTWVRSRLA